MPENKFSDIVTILPAEGGGAEIRFEVKGFAELSKEERQRVLDWLTEYAKQVLRTQELERRDELRKEPELAGKR